MGYAPSIAAFIITKIACCNTKSRIPAKGTILNMKLPHILVHPMMKRWGDSDLDHLPLLLMTDNDDTHTPSSTHIFENPLSFIIYQPTTSVTNHFESGPGRNLSNKSQIAPPEGI
jgi:hypothetical protein